jgi:hypothetical protein
LGHLLHLPLLWWPWLQTMGHMGNLLHLPLLWRPWLQTMGHHMHWLRHRLQQLPVVGRQYCAEISLCSRTGGSCWY